MCLSNPRSCFEADVNYENFIQLFDCRIAADTEDIGRKLKDGVLSYLAGLPKKSPEEIRSDTAWCRKMLLRTRRGDAEGMFRWHWLLVDSLEIFCGMAGHPYFGPKKSLRWMKQEHPEAYTLYTDALTHFEFQAAERWVDFLERSLDFFSSHLRKKCLIFMSTDGKLSELNVKTSMRGSAW